MPSKGSSPFSILGSRLKPSQVSVPSVLDGNDDLDHASEALITERQQTRQGERHSQLTRGAKVCGTVPGPAPTRGYWRSPAFATTRWRMGNSSSCSFEI